MNFTFSASRCQQLLRRWATLAETDAAEAKRCDAIVAVYGTPDASTPENQRGQAVIQYLLNSKNPIPDVAIVMGKKETLIAVGDEQINIAVPEEGLEGHVVRVVKGSAAANEALTALLSSGVPVGVTPGELDIQKGDFATALVATLRTAVPAEHLVSAAPFIGELLFEKDAEALAAVEKAAGLCCAVFRRYAKDEVAGEMGRKQPKTLYDVRRRLYAALETPTTVPGLEKLEAGDFSMVTAMPPCIFHKGTYNASLTVGEDVIKETTSVPMHGDVLVVRYGMKNMGHTAFFARTLIVSSSAPSNAREAYQFMFDVSAKVIELLVPGTTLSSVYESAMDYATSLNADFAKCLSKSFGFSTGLLVMPARGNISEKGTAVVSDGMPFVTRVVLERIPVPGAQEGEGSDTYDMELTDTVLVRGGVAELKTKVTRGISDILYEDMEESGDDGEGYGAAEQRNLGKITRQGQSETVLVSREAQRDEDLRKLLRSLHEAFLAAGGKKGTHTPTEEFRSCEIGRLALGETRHLAANESAPPPQAKEGIFVQEAKQVIWFPVCGQPNAFHACTISKVDVKREGDRYTMTVAFHSMQEANVGYKLNRTKVFLKELTYSSPRDAFTETQIAIQGLLQRVKNDDAARKRSLTSASTGKLVQVPGLLRLPQVKMRPPLLSTGRQNKGCVGNLELHGNGLRFASLGSMPVDMLFDNIKHVIFQPADNSLCVIYHVTLKKAIEVGRKAITEVQFVAEVMESSEVASAARRGYEEEIRAEEREEQRVKETNKQFYRFAQAVDTQSKGQVRTQIPQKQFSFDGVHTRAMTTFKGTPAVLWAVSEWPAFTQSVEEVEVVSFERVLAGGVTFDMSLIMKDYNKPVITINSIPRSSLEAVKDWCLRAGLYYMETAVNPNWKVTMKEVRDDEDWQPFAPGEGWSVLNNDDGDEEDEEGAASDTDSDSTYYESEDEESSDDDDSSWLEDEESDVDSSDADSDDDSAVSWDELERRAVAKDRQHGHGDDDEENPRKRARTAGGNGRPAAPPSGMARGAPANPPSSNIVKRPVAFNRGAPPPARRF